MTFEIDGDVLKRCTPEEGETTAVVPKGVKAIGKEAFSSCKNLESVVIPEGVTEIGERAFCECKKLESVVIPEGVTKIGDRAFGWCLGLKSVVIPEGVTKIGVGAFRNCGKLKNVVIPEGVTEIGGLAFDYCGKLKSIVIPEGVTKIRGRTFYHCKNLESVVIPEGVTEICKDAFSRCGIKNVVIPKGVTKIGEWAFWECKKLESVVIPKGVRKIWEHAFEDCENLKSVVIPEGVTEIGERAFRSCKKLESVVIPEGVTEIGEYAFDNCENLKSVVIPEGVTKIGVGAFRNCGKLKNVVIPEGVTEIGEYAFYKCENLKSVVIPESTMKIGVSAFENCSSLTSIQIMNPRTEMWGQPFRGCHNLERMILSDDGSILFYCPPAIAVGDVVIPESVRRIRALAFGNCVNLKKVHIASPSTHIEPGAFTGCTGLEHMILTDNETVLAYCPPACANGRVRLPETITRIEDYAFVDCKQLTAVDFPDGLLQIDDNAFKGCTQLASVNFSDGPLEIGRSAFDGCPLKSVTLPPSVKNAPEYAFPGCREITIYDSIDADGGDCYENFKFKSNRNRGQSGPKIGFMSINSIFDPLNCTVIVRSAATGDIKYIVEVDIDYDNWDYRNLFFFGWGKNATFAFRELDKIFPKIKGATHKQRVALLRLQYGVDLDEEMRDYYQKYVSRNIKEILLMCIREERMDWIKVCEEAGVLRKATVEYAIEQATAEKKPAFTAFFLEYQNKHFPLKAGKDNTGLRLPDLPREKKPADKTSEESI